MRRVAFNVALVASLAMLVLFTLGFVGKVGVLRRRAGPTSSYQQTVALERGRLTIWTQTWPTTSQMQMPKPVTIQPMVSFRLRFPRIDGRAFGGFDAHPLPVAGGSSLYLVACPIWALALPFLIAPTIWMRRRLAERRRKRQQHGFPINSSEPEPQPQ